MKTIINLTSDSNEMDSSKELTMIKSESIEKMIERDIKSIIKTLQLNYQKHQNEEKNEFSISDPLLSLLPFKTGKECQICLEEKEFKNDKIIKCLVCRERAHQNCYGSDLLGKKEVKDWICLRCKELIKCQKNYEINRCIFCPKVTGITKKIGTNLWGHITCVNLIPDIFFETEHKDSVELSNLKSFRKSICNICEKRCDKGKCKFQMHISCGIITGCVFNWELMKKLQKNKYIFNKMRKKKKDFLEIYCPKHTLELFQENSSNALQITSQTTQEESNHDDKFLGKKLKKTLELDEIIPFENINYESHVYSFNNLVEKFIDFIERDRERIKNHEIPILRQDSILKLQNFIKRFVEIYKDYHPDLNEVNELIKQMK